MAMNQEVKERIFQAADQLFEASSDGEYPNVEAVRQLSRAGMNNVVEAMKEWRAKQRKNVQTVREPLPVELHGVLQSAAQNLWETAQQLANESLETARAAFEAEKDDLTELSSQQSAAFEEQAAQLEAAQVRISELELQVSAAAEQHTQQAVELTNLRVLYDGSQSRAALAEQKAEEVEHRAAELRTELDRSHQDADQLRRERDEASGRALGAEAQRNEITKDLESVRNEFATYRATTEANNKIMAEQMRHSADQATKAEAERDRAKLDADNARGEAAKARENAAKLTGELEAIREQNKVLLAALKPAEKKR